MDTDEVLDVTTIFYMEGIEGREKIFLQAHFKADILR